MDLERPTLALWATNLARPLNGIAGWAEAVDAKMAEAKAAGAALLVMPEYAAEQWLSFAPDGLAPDREIPWLAGQAEAALAALAPLPARHDVALLAGSMPVRVEQAREPGAPPYRNRAHLLLPDGRIVVQDKLCLTPAERTPEAWNLDSGDRLEIVTWRGLRLATLICLDVELPALAARLAEHAPDLVLVPSMTGKPAGHHRVFGCAKARAVELQAAVAAVGCIGSASPAKPRETNVGGAAVFLPCEEALGHEGLAGRIGPLDRAEDEGPLLLARDLPIDTIRALRGGAAEVWPGAWQAEHIVVGEAAGPAESAVAGGEAQT